MNSPGMIVDDIDSLNLNDSLVNEIRITHLNEIEIDLQLIVSYETQESVPCRLVFSECNSASLDLNLAYEGCDTIHSSAQSARDDAYVEYHIETNTTASKIKVVAKRLYLLKF